MKKIFQSETDEQLQSLITVMEHQVKDDRELSNEALSLTIAQDKANKLDVIMKFWPYIKPVLSIAKIFTNSKIDALIDAVIAWGDNYTTEHE